MPSRVERHTISRTNKELDNLCFRAKNLYNLANYLIRQAFINSSKKVKLGELNKATWLRYGSVYNSLKKHEDYKNLPAQTSQQVLRLLDRNWTSFFKAIRIYNSNPESFTGKPKLPKYKHKVKGRSIVTFTNQQIRLRNGFIIFPKAIKLKNIKTKVKNIQQVRIIPQATCFVLEVIYERPIKKSNVDKDKILSIDLGLNNLATCINNKGFEPFIINGKPIKSVNQYYNKKKSILQSFIDSKGTSSRILKLTLKRNNKIKDYLHKASRFIIDYCIENKISTIVIGNNKQWKTKINIGKRNNQNFVSIPFDTFINQLEYKAEDVGIKVIRTEESYTSKCSFLDKEKIQKHKSYLGKRIKRGLFKSSDGTLINADCNGAYNILRKVIPNSFDDGIEGVVLHPVKINSKLSTVLNKR